MPVRIKKLKGGRYRVSTPGGTKSKSTSLKKAKAQERLLNMKHGGIIPERGWKK